MNLIIFVGIKYYCLKKHFTPKICLGFNFVDILYFDEYNRHWYLRRRKSIYFSLNKRDIKIMCFYMFCLIFAALTTQEVLEKDLKCVTHSNQTVVMSSIPVSLEVSYYGNTYFICSCIWMIIQVTIIQIYIMYASVSIGWALVLSDILIVGHNKCW